MLDKAKKILPEVADSEDRFEVPKVKGHIQGNKTVISNFMQIASTVRRTPDHMLKYILKELAAPGHINKTLLIIGTKIPSKRINEKINSYVENYVICNACGKPDTSISTEGTVTTLTCQACGAKHTVK